MTAADDVPPNDPEALRAFLTNLGRRPTSEEFAALSAKQTTPEAERAFQVVWTGVLGWEDPGELDDDDDAPLASRDALRASFALIREIEESGPVTEDHLAALARRIEEMNREWPSQLEVMRRVLSEVKPA